MRSAVLIALSAALTIAVSAAAHNQAQTPDISRSTVVLEGCLQNANDSSSLSGTPFGTSAAPAKAGDIASRPEPPPLYILTDARPAAGAGQSSPRSVGTTVAATTHADGTVTRNARAENDAPKTYALVGNQTDLAEHNGRRVEVSGTIAPTIEVGERKIDPPGATPKAADDGEHFTVVSIRPLGPSCSRR